MIIYKITNLMNGKIYIGQTINSLKRRWNAHCRGNRPGLNRAIRKYGKDNFTIEIMYKCRNIDELNKKESELIVLYNSTFPNGYNLTSKCSNKGTSEQTKEKLRRIFSKRFSEILCIDNNTVYDNISQASKTLGIDRKLINDNLLGRTNKANGKRFVFTDVNKRQRSEDVRKERDERRKSKIEKRQMRIRCVETNIEFDSIKEASNLLKIATSLIGAVIRGHQDTAKGLSFRYIDDKLDSVRVENTQKRIEDTLKGRQRSIMSKSIKIICLDNGIEYPSISEAGRILKIHHNSIRNMLSGRVKKAGGMVFQYIPKST
jgi:group I intron endonuclease